MIEAVDETGIPSGRLVPEGDNWADVRHRFRWRIPDRFNIAAAVCDRHADSDATALVVLDSASGAAHELDFGWFRDGSRRLANVLTAHGITRGDRIGVLLGQCPETALAHLATYRMGAIAMPLFTAFGEDALAYRLGHAGATALVTHVDQLDKLASIRDRVPDLRLVLAIGGEGRPLPDGVRDFGAELARASDRFEMVDTAADDPALLIYTSGTTGPPKGALHAHRVLLGHLPGVEVPHDGFPVAGDRFWTPADWAWIGGLLDVLLPAWFHRVPVVASRAMRFDPEAAFELMAGAGVRNVFLPPTALRMLREVPDPARFGHRLRSIGTGGETMGAELLDWGREALGVTIHEFYGQTECNLVLGNCEGLAPVIPGAMGRPIPGHHVEIVDDEGHPLPAGEEGDVAVRAPDPVMFLGYWRDEAATRAKFRGEWLVTGDRAIRDREGCFHFVGRDDDVITSAGYRIGPGEIEDCLVAHPSIALAAAVGVPDPVRTQTIKAFVVLRQGVPPSATLEAEIRDHVRRRLAAHEVPRRIEFVPALPTTATGKIRRRDLREREAERIARDQGAAP